MKQSWLGVVCLAALAACGDTLVAPVAQRIKTDSMSYTAVPVGNGQVGFRVVTRFTNSTNGVATLERCVPGSTTPLFEIGLVGATSSGGSAYSPIWACVGGVSPIMVAPGAARVDTLFLRGPTGVPTTPPNLEGTFQIEMSGVVSNQFTVKLSAGAVAPTS